MCSSDLITTAKLAADSVRLAEMLPSDASRIVGVPRSGMIPAAIIATHLHLPLWELVGNQFRQLAKGSRGWRQQEGRTVIVDDTVYGGFAMQKARRAREAQGSLFAAVYVRPDQCSTVDHYVRAVDHRSHLLEWNFFNNHGIQRAGVATDFDGVLCEEPPVPDADDGPILEQYRQWLPVAKPKMLSRAEPIRLIVTGRLERWRPETEAWLATWGVRFEKLTMYPSDRASRRGDVAAWKAEHYRNSATGYFVESDPAQAARIHAITGKQVICPTIAKVWA